MENVSPERGGTGSSARAGWRLLGSWRALLLTGFGCLLNSVIVLLFAFA
jgi:hypothetical protein